MAKPTQKVLPVICLGGGPAGLTAAYHLSKKGRKVVVLEADKRYVGGISRTVEYKGFRFDIGGHRFFSKSNEVEALWTEILGNDLLTRPRKSRIFYKGSFFSYPLKPVEALVKMGLLETVRCILSFARARLFPNRQVKSFQDWVTNQFGKRLFQIFFKSYTEKVWGMPCDQISADWAAQRIKNLSLGVAISNALSSLFGRRKGNVTSLIEEFRYPRLGPGMMWERAQEKICARGGEVHLGAKVTELSYNANEKIWTVTYQTADETKTLLASDLVSTLAIKDLFQILKPAVPEAVQQAAQGLRYRDFLIVVLILRRSDPFDDNWIYIHDPRVKVGRIQNFKSWSPEMVPDPSLSSLGLEYFCQEKDSLWSSSDQELLALAKNELEQIGLAKVSDAIDGTIIRQPKAYPVYDDVYQNQLAVLRDYLKNALPSLHLAGRNGMHKYNNQDHSMMTALLAAENIIAGQPVYDVWNVNENAEYHETKTKGESLLAERLVPERIKKAA